MASLGTGIVKPNQTLICGGSFWQQEVNVTEPITDPHAAIRVNCHVVPNLWQYETIAFSQVSLCAGFETLLPRRKETC